MACGGKFLIDMETGRISRRKFYKDTQKYLKYQE